jgi:hypothetical protein
MAKIGLSKKAAELVSRLRTCDTFAGPLAEDFDRAAYVGPVMDLVDQVTNALSRGKITPREAAVANKEAVRVMREIKIRMPTAKIRR